MSPSSRRGFGRRAVLSNVANAQTRAYLNRCAGLRGTSISRASRAAPKSERRFDLTQPDGDARHMRGKVEPETDHGFKERLGRE